MKPRAPTARPSPTSGCARTWPTSSSPTPPRPCLGLLDAARTSKLPLTATLERLLEVEVDATEERRLASRLRFACLPAPWPLADFDFAAQPGIDEALIRDLATLRFLDEGANVLFIGPPGVGKTMLAVGLARAGAEAGHRVYFTTAADLAARCHKAAIEGRWAT